MKFKLNKNKHGFIYRNRKRMIIVLLISITIFPLLKSSNDSQPIQDDSKTSYLTESSTNAAFRDSSQSSPTTQSKNITKDSPSQKNIETIKSRIDDKHEKEKDIQITSSHCDKEKSKTITNNKDDIQNNVDSNTNKESMNEEVQKNDSSSHSSNPNEILHEQNAENKENDKNEIKEHTHIFHSNTGVWLNSQQECEDFVDNEFSKWDEKLSNGEISYDEYTTSCPWGYETLICTCGKRTINFSYR